MMKNHKKPNLDILPGSKISNMLEKSWASFLTVFSEFRQFSENFRSEIELRRQTDA